MRTLGIDRSFFTMAFGRDVDYQDWPPRRFLLDRCTGEVLWYYECDEDAYMETGMPAAENCGERDRVEAQPGRFLEIPGLDHGEHQAILRDFLASGWSDEEARRLRAETGYTGSIGGWIRDVGDEGAVRTFYEYREARITAMAGAFLRENGIAPDWKRPA